MRSHSLGSSLRIRLDPITPRLWKREVGVASIITAPIGPVEGSIAALAWPPWRPAGWQRDITGGGRRLSVAGDRDGDRSGDGGGEVNDFTRPVALARDMGKPGTRRNGDSRGSRRNDSPWSHHHESEDVGASCWSNKSSRHRDHCRRRGGWRWLRDPGLSISHTLPASWA